MAIREEIVASAAQFLQDPSVAASSIENKISFLRTKNLTQEEIDAALARAGGSGAVAPRAPYAAAPPGPPQGPPQQYYQPYPQYAWQPPAATPKRDWRDWFIMATVVGGVSYGLFSLGKRYVYPLVAPPTPEKLEQDKKSIEEQFDKAFALVEQLSKDTEALKDAEKQRTERLDVTLADLETIMAELKTANKRREDDAQRIRDEVQGLKDAIPRAMNNQKEITDNRLAEINTELTSLKTLVSQRMNAASNPTASTGYFRGANGINGINGTNGVNNGTSGTASPTAAAAQSPNESATETGATPKADAAKGPSRSNFGRPSGMSSGSGKASIPAWQMAMANQNAGAAASSASSSSGKEAEKAPAEAAAGSS
ncbi:Peroxisomal membrane protein PEX14 [Trichoderma ghanense]|uniref:Peroxisomal membrane protein PEX14 n=1 Tax=Trichoderma ghanense TaxID=65468 RepID=A0ABY2GP83_9HYPO